MGLVTAFQYKDFFDGPRPAYKDVVQDHASRHIIGLMTIINEMLHDETRNQKQVQESLFLNFCADFPEAEKLKIIPIGLNKISNGELLFDARFSMEVVLREYLDFKHDEKEVVEARHLSLTAFKAYLIVIDELMEHDHKIVLKSLDNDSVPDPVKIMWPHLIQQFEFTNRPELFYEIHKGKALLAYLANHPTYKKYTDEYLKNLGCNSDLEYFTQLLSLITPHITHEKKVFPADSFFRIKAESNLYPVLESLLVDINEIKADKRKQENYLGLKEKPLFEFSPGIIICPYWDYLYSALFTGLLFSFYKKSGVKQEFARFEDFKNEVSAGFSELTLFQKIMTFSFGGQKHGYINTCQIGAFNPDFYYRSGNNVFIFEFKDNMLNSNVILSESYEKIKEAVDEKFIATKNGRDKGITQLINNTKLLFQKTRELKKGEGVGGNFNDDLLWEIDPKAKAKKLRVRNLKIHPIIVYDNMYFDLPGINDYLSGRMNELVQYEEIGATQIAPLVMINLKYFYHRIFLFSDAIIKMNEQLNEFYKGKAKAKTRALRTGEQRDWFWSLASFDLYFSSAPAKYFDHRRMEFLKTIANLWNFNWV